MNDFTARGVAFLHLAEPGGPIMTAHESLWTNLASLAVVGASFALLAFVLTTVLAR